MAGGGPIPMDAALLEFVCTVDEPAVAAVAAHPLPLSISSRSPLLCPDPYVGVVLVPFLANHFAGDFQ